MKLDNVYYGFTKDGERKLLWKKFKVEVTELGDLTRTMYYDLERKEYIEPEKVDESSLVSVVKLVGNYKRKSKRKIIKAYKADCNLPIDVTGAFYGNIVWKKRFINTDNLYDTVLVPELENVLFARISEPECRVQRVESGKLYPWSYRVTRGISVNEIRPINKQQFSEVVITKKKLLEADYKKEL